MNTEDIAHIAGHLDQARVSIQEVERITLQHPNLSLDDAYRVQKQGIALRIARSEKQVGYKMGLTSRAKREQMNLTSPIYGVLTDAMQISDGADFSLSRLIHPRIEAEIAFITKKDIRGKITSDEALQSVDSICAALEILDSRYLHFKYFSLPDVVADNASSSHFVLSQTRFKPSEVDVAHLEMVMDVNGVPVQTAFSSAISEHPLNSLVQLSHLLMEDDQLIPAGSIVLAGAATLAIPMEPRTRVKLKVENLGEVTVRVNAD